MQSTASPTASGPGFRCEQVRFSSPSLRAGTVPLRFAHLSDLHLRRLDGRYERLWAELAARELDFIFLTGDFASRCPSTWRLLDRFLSRLSCRYGVFACRGNWEIKHDAPRAATLRELFRKAGARMLINESAEVPTASGLVRVAGVDDVVRGWPDFRAAFAREGGSAFTLLLAHAPLAVRFVPPGARVDLTLSGHTHGGQVRIPLLWRMFLPECSGGFRDGLYELGETRLYVSRGFGSVGPVPVRFRCPAEVTLFEVGPAASAASEGA